MPYSSQTADRWYIAELTEEVTLEGDPQNLVLVRRLGAVVRPAAARPVPPPVPAPSPARRPVSK